MLLRIFIIDSVDFRRFDDDITVKLEGTKYRTGICRGIRITCTSDTYHHSSLLDMTKGSPSDEHLSHSLCRYSTHDPYRCTETLYSLSDSKSIDYDARKARFVEKAPSQLVDDVISVIDVCIK